MAYFPMFIEIENKDCLVVGGGHVALRKVEVLRDFKARVTVIAPSIWEKVRGIPEVLCIEREFKAKDVDNRFLVVAATEDAGLNQEIAGLCREQSTFVNAVDQIEDCSFIFPSYLRAGDAVAAFSSSGKSPVLTQYLKSETRKIVEETLGDFDRIGPINEYMGNLRARIKEAFGSEQERRAIYKKLLSECLKRGGPLPEQETREWIEQCRQECSAVHTRDAGVPKD